MYLYHKILIIRKVFIWYFINNTRYIIFLKYHRTSLELQCNPIYLLLVVKSIHLWNFLVFMALKLPLMKSNFQRKNLKFLLLKVIFHIIIGKFKPKYSVYLLDLFPFQQRNTFNMRKSFADFFFKISQVIFIN